MRCPRDFFPGGRPARGRSHGIVWWWLVELVGWEPDRYPVHAVTVADKYPLDNASTGRAWDNVRRTTREGTTVTLGSVSPRRADTRRNNERILVAAAAALTSSG